MSTSRGRTTRRVTMFAVAVLGVATAAVAVERSDDADTTSAAVPAAAAETATVEVGDLTTTVSLDGSVELSDTTTVVHRIEGETASAATTPASEATSAPAGASSVAFPAADCPTDSTVPTPETTTTVPPETSTTVPPENPSTVPPDTATTVPPETTTTTSTTMPPTTGHPATTVATGPTAPDGCDVADPSTSVPLAGAGLPGGGGPVPGSGGSSSAGSTPTSAARTTQVVTSVVAAGSVVELGDPLYTVDGTPVVALVGNLPAWRSLSTDSDDGPDIRQLESSLVQLGYGSDGEITIDDEFDAATETAVEHWQQGLGVEVTGEVALGAVAFVPASVTVGSVLVAVGDEIGEGDDVLTLDAETQQILATVPEEDQQLVAPGTSVDVDGELGTVTVLRSSTADGVVSVVAVIATDAPLAGATAGRAVSVDITTTDAIGVLMVPVEAVASRLDGTYAVQVVAGSTIEWVTVEILGQAGTRVGIRGDGLAEGTEVVVPE